MTYKENKCKPSGNGYGFGQLKRGIVASVEESRREREDLFYLSIEKAPPPCSPPWHALVVIVNNTKHAQSASPSSKNKKRPGNNFGPHQDLEMPGRLCRERRSAATAARCVRILKCKSRTHHIRRMVDRDAVQILGRKHIDK